MIEYVEIRNKSNRNIIGIIDSAKSIIWHAAYYGVGDFEIYASASKKHLELLKEGNYVTRTDNIEVGIIESVRITDNVQDGTMIIASGRFAKSILDRRQIYKLAGKTNTPTILNGNVENAVRSVVANNAIACHFDSKRNISFLELGALANIPLIIVDENGQPTSKQVSYRNLLEYTDEVLKEYNLGATITLDDSTRKLKYYIYAGADRSVDNTVGNESIIFSPEYDNLTESNYSISETNKKTSVLIGGEGEGLERFYSLIAGNEQGFERREMWVDASSISKTYEDSDGVEQQYTDAEYKKMLDALGTQELSIYVTTENFECAVNVQGGIWRLNEDYYLGDIVTIQDNKISKYANVRIAEITEVQDENGYSIEPTFEHISKIENIEVLATENGEIIVTEDYDMLGGEN